MRENDNRSGDLVSELVEVFIALLDLLIQSLVFNLQLLVINQMETVCELLLSAEDLLLICKSVSESDVLKPVLMYFLIFCLVVLFPVLDHLGTQLLSSPAENSILSDTSLQLLELMFNFLAFLLLLVELVL